MNYEPDTIHAVIVEEDGTEVHYGTDRDYLLWRLNRNYKGEDPGAPDYVAVRKTGKWTEPA